MILTLHLVTSNLHAPLQGPIQASQESRKKGSLFFLPFLHRAPHILLQAQPGCGTRTRRSPTQAPDPAFSRLPRSAPVSHAGNHSTRPCVPPLVAAGRMGRGGSPPRLLWEAGTHREWETKSYTGICTVFPSVISLRVLKMSSLSKASEGNQTSERL